MSTKCLLKRTNTMGKKEPQSCGEARSFVAECSRGRTGVELLPGGGEKTPYAERRQPIQLGLQRPVVGRRKIPIPVEGGQRTITVHVVAVVGISVRHLRAVHDVPAGSAAIRTPALAAARRALEPADIL